MIKNKKFWSKCHNHKNSRKNASVPTSSSTEYAKKVWQQLYVLKTGGVVRLKVTF